jgi:hypothetical protein
MAKVTAPLHSLTAHGSIGHTLTMLRQLGANIAKKKSKPTGPPTPAQIAQRAAYQAAVADWNALTPEQKLTWKTAADARAITPFNAYMSAALLSAVPPLGTIWDDGATIWDDGATTWD